MGQKRIRQELTTQMKALGLRFNETDPLILEEVIEQTVEYIDESYGTCRDDAQRVADYLRETMEEYPIQIEPIREYIEPAAVHAI